MQNGVSVRIRLFCAKRKIQFKDLCPLTNVAKQTISGYFNGRCNIPLEFIIEVLKTYSNISTDWLLFGEGEMEVDRVSIDRLNSIIEKKNAEIAVLQHQVEQLKKRMDTILNNLK